MEINVQSYGIDLPPAFSLARTGAKQDQAKPAMQDRYTPSQSLTDDGMYSRDEIIKTMRASQEVLLGVELDNTAMSVLGEKPAALERPESPHELDAGDKELIQRLQQRDREVHLEEQTHVSVAGKYARGAPSYNYQMGPDGRMYAVGGRVAVDTGSTGNSAEDQIKSRTLRAAALGVANPSTADAMVAMHAGNLTTANLDPLAATGFSAVA